MKIKGNDSSELLIAIRKNDLYDVDFSFFEVFDAALRNGVTIKKSSLLLREEEEFIARAVSVEFIVYGDYEDEKYFSWEIIIS